MANFYCDWCNSWKQLSVLPSWVTRPVSGSTWNNFVVAFVFVILPHVSAFCLQSVCNTAHFVQRILKMCAISDNTRSALKTDWWRRRRSWIKSREEKGIESGRSLQTSTTLENPLTVRDCCFPWWYLIDCECESPNDDKDSWEDENINWTLRDNFDWSIGLGRGTVNLLPWTGKFDRFRILYQV